MEKTIWVFNPGKCIEITYGAFKKQCTTAPVLEILVQWMGAGTGSLDPYVAAQSDSDAAESGNYYY